MSTLYHYHVRVAMFPIFSDEVETFLADFADMFFDVIWMAFLIVCKAVNGVVEINPRDSNITS